MATIRVPYPGDHEERRALFERAAAHLVRHGKYEGTPDGGSFQGKTPIGSFAVGNTGGAQSWRTVPANIAGTTGTHNVYLTFTSGQPAAFVSVNWFDFGH